MDGLRSGFPKIIKGGFPFCRIASFVWHSYWLRDIGEKTLFYGDHENEGINSRNRMILWNR